MNYSHDITVQCQKLPVHLQKEVLDFIGFLENRYLPKPSITDNSELTDHELEQACGVLSAPHSVTLAEMDEAIKSRGGRL